LGSKNGSSGTGGITPLRPTTQALKSNPDPLGWREAVAQGRFIDQPSPDWYPIPGRLNVALAIVQFTACFGLLALASHATSLWATAAIAVAFAFLMQLGFCLAHEAVHGKLHVNRHVNQAVGILLYSMYPGSYHLFEISHLTHHRRNRSDAELEDYVLPTETAWLKRVNYYFVLCGLFWLMTPLAFVLLALTPGSLRMPAPREDAGALYRYLQFLNQVHRALVRRDLLITVTVWIGASLLLHFKLAALAICYAAFAFCWASQQYIYHLRTPRHAVLGAWDLRLWRPLELLYLHFNYHLTHHVAAWVPWIYLPKVAAERPTRNFLAAYFSQWRPPQPLGKAWPPRFQASGPLPARTKRVPASAGRPL
jgi:fatty acid desaturase